MSGIGSANQRIEPCWVGHVAWPEAQSALPEGRRTVPDRPQSSCTRRASAEPRQGVQVAAPYVPCGGLRPSWHGGRDRRSRGLGVYDVCSCLVALGDPWECWPVGHLLPWGRVLPCVCVAGGLVLCPVSRRVAPLAELVCVGCVVGFWTAGVHRSRSWSSPWWTGCPGTGPVHCGCGGCSAVGSACQVAGEACAPSR